MLKYLDLSHSVYLKETPDFSYFPNVEKLLLVNCKSLVLVHKSIGILDKKLIHLNLNGCIELDALPEELYKLKSLETLLLSYCSKLERLDDALGELESLTTLVADFTALREIPSSINQLKKLKELSLNGCKGLLSDDIDILHSEKSSPASLLLPISFNGLSCLSTLSLAYCNLSDESIPKDIGSLSSLVNLDLRGNNFCNPQTDFASLTNLSDLSLGDCSKLQSILSLPRSLSTFMAENCISLERTPDLSECSLISLCGCVSLVETPWIHNLKRLNYTSVKRCNPGTSNTITKMMVEGWIKRNHNCIYLPGYSLPNWVSFKEEMRSFSFTVPETHNPVRAIGFTVWAGLVGQIGDLYKFPRAITVKNLTRGGAWIHSPVHEILNPFTFSNRLTNGFHIETGDQIEVDVDCDDRNTIRKTGFALSYNTRDSSDVSFGDIQFTYERNHLYYFGDGLYFRCFWSKNGRDPLQAVVHYLDIGKIKKKSYSMNGVVPELYACSVFPVTSRYQENKQPAVEESHQRPLRKTRTGLRKILGAIGFLALVVVLGKYGKPLRSIHRRPVGEKDVEKD